MTNLSFTEITETSSQHADLRLALSSLLSTAWTYLPNGTFAEGEDSWFDTSSYLSPALGNYDLATFRRDLPRPRLAVEPQQVVPGEGEAADGRLGV